jgi:hypothetical protein
MKRLTGPNGETLPDTKGDGQGVMLSAFQSREFSYGLDLCKEELDEVNLSRRGERYKDVDAAKNKRQRREASTDSLTLHSRV